MIMIASIFSFLSVFFLGLTASNMIRSEEEEARLRIKERLSDIEKSFSASVHIEKNNRMSDLPILDRFLRRMAQMKELQDYLNQAGLTVSVGVFILISLLFGVSAFFLAGLMGINPSLAMFLGGVTFIVPLFYAGACRGQRIKRFSNRFPDVIGLMSSSLRAGHSMQMAVESVVTENRDIASVEFEKLLSEVEVGQSFEEALKGMLKRIDTQDLRLFISAVVLQRETGGNLAELLDSLENVIRERQEMKRELKASTAQARLSGLVLGLLPMFVGIIVLAIHPAYILFFISDPAGQKLLCASIAGQGLGILMIQKIVHIDM